MATIRDIIAQSCPKIDIFEIELIIAHILKKPREFVLAYPEYTLRKQQTENIRKNILRRTNHEPIAYILGHKQFYGLDFKTDKNVLIPRPETEMLVDTTIEEIRRKNKKASIIDVGTGSGNIIISIADSIKKFKLPIADYRLLAIDISKKALHVAKHNAKKNKVDKKIKFIKSNLLSCLLKNNLMMKYFNNLIIVANLPYLSKKIYNATMPDVKNYEPKSALHSGKEGLDYYEKLFKQIKNILSKNYKLKIIIILEISPEQKNKITSLIKKYFSRSKITFKKDLVDRWRVCILKTV